MKPSIGRVVTTLGVQSNGSNEHPALVNRVWFAHDTNDGPGMVNLTIFPDMGAPTPRGSVYLHETREEAEKYLAEHPGNIAAFWPERV
ncbi:MAG: hypothetical protein ACREVL_16545, partial [Solimonas sp.]